MYVRPTYDQALERLNDRERYEKFDLGEGFELEQLAVSRFYNRSIYLKLGHNILEMTKTLYPPSRPNHHAGPLGPLSGPDSPERTELIRGHEITNTVVLAGKLNFQETTEGILANKSDGLRYEQLGRLAIITIGRETSPYLALDDSASRNHVKIFDDLYSDYLLFRDNRSTNGTAVYIDTVEVPKVIQR